MIITARTLLGGVVALVALALLLDRAGAATDPVQAGWAASHPVGQQGGSIDSIKRLPPWQGGAWALDPESFGKTRQSSGSTDLNNPNVPKLAPKWRDYRLANGAANGGQGPAGGVPNNAARCIPDGMPGIMTAPLQFEMLFTPGRVTIIASNGEVRRIYTDGRAIPKDADRKFEGFSIGHWEADTLVVYTEAILPKAELFMGLPEEEGTHVLERMRMTSRTKFEIKTLVTNPRELAEPWAYTRTFDRQATISDDICQENNRDSPGHLDLTPPPE